MNVADSEVVHSVMHDAGFTRTQEEDLVSLSSVTDMPVRPLVAANDRFLSPCLVG
jgi:hypothetical protein